MPPKRNRMFLPVTCGSPFVRSRRTGFHCRSRRPELWLPRTAGRVEAPGRRRAGWRGCQHGNCITTPPVGIHIASSSWLRWRKSHTTDITTTTSFLRLSALLSHRLIFYLLTRLTAALKRSDRANMQTINTNIENCLDLVNWHCNPLNRFD